MLLRAESINEIVNMTKINYLIHDYIHMLQSKCHRLFRADSVRHSWTYGAGLVLCRQLPVSRECKKQMKKDVSQDISDHKLLNWVILLRKQHLTHLNANQIRCKLSKDKVSYSSHPDQNVSGRLYSSESVSVHGNVDKHVHSRVSSSVFVLCSCHERMWSHGLSRVLQVAAGVMGQCWLGLWWADALLIGAYQVFLGTNTWGFCATIIPRWSCLLIGL